MKEDSLEYSRKVAEQLNGIYGCDLDTGLIEGALEKSVLKISDGIKDPITVVLDRISTPQLANCLLHQTQDLDLLKLFGKELPYLKEKGLRVMENHPVRAIGSSLSVNEKGELVVVFDLGSCYFPLTMDDGVLEELLGSMVAMAAQMNESQE